MSPNEAEKGNSVEQEGDVAHPHKDMSVCILEKLIEE
jgi:hypothetical protein